MIDNMLMNILVLRLAYVLTCMKPRWLPTVGMSLFGAVYALLSMARLPVLSAVVPKLLLGAAMAWPLAESLRDYPRAVVRLYISAFLMGGWMYALSTLLGGGMYGGVLVTTTPIRVFLLAACGCAMLPRIVLTMLHALRKRAGFVRIRIRLEDRILELTALVDTGNLLSEPLSGKPVVVVQPGLLPDIGNRPVPYRTVGGGGVMMAFAPKAMYVKQRNWRAVDGMVAASENPIAAADAIIGSALLTEEGRHVVGTDANETSALVYRFDQSGSGRALLHSFRRDAACAVPGARGADVDRAPNARQQGGQERAD